MTDTRYISREEYISIVEMISEDAYKKVLDEVRVLVFQGKAYEAQAFIDSEIPRITQGYVTYMQYVSTELNSDIISEFRYVTRRGAMQYLNSNCCNGKDEYFLYNDVVAEVSYRLANNFYKQVVEVCNEEELEWAHPLVVEFSNVVTHFEVINLFCI